MDKPSVEQGKARRALIHTFVSVIDDEVTVTLQSELEDAVEHLPPEQREGGRRLLEASGLDGHNVRLYELFGADPDPG